MKRLLKAMGLLLAVPLLWAAAAQFGAPIVIPTIASMEALGPASAVYPNAYVLGYNSAFDGGGGLFSWNGASTSTTNGGTIFQASGVSTGRWLRQFQGPLTSLMFGTDPTGATNSTTAMQLAWNASGTASLGLPIVDPPGTFKLSDMTAVPGMSYSGSGVGTDAITGGGGTILDFSSAGSANPCIAMQLPNGTNNIVGASFYNFYEKCPGTYGIRENSIAGGFTNDGTTQDYLFNVNIIGVSISGGTTAAIQLSKCFHANVNASVNNNYFTPGDHVDFEGCDTSQVSGGRYYPTNGSAIKFVAHSTFGNYDLVSGSVEIGAFDNSHPAIYLDSRSDMIEPGVNIEGTSTGAYISIGPDGTTHSIQGVVLSANGSSHWLDFAGNCPLTVNAQDNNQFTSTPGAVGAPTRCAIWFNSSLMRHIWYSANPDNGSTLPFVSSNTDSYRNGYQWYISPSDAQSMLFGDGCGSTATATAGAFDFSQCGAGIYMDFYSNGSSAGSITGTVTTNVVAYCNGGTGTLNIRGDDGSHSTTIQNVNITLSSVPKTFNNAFGATGTYSTFMIFMARPGTCADPRIISVGVNAS